MVLRLESWEWRWLLSYLLLLWVLGSEKLWAIPLVRWNLWAGTAENWNCQKLRHRLLFFSFLMLIFRYWPKRIINLLLFWMFYHLLWLFFLFWLEALLRLFVIIKHMKSIICTDICSAPSCRSLARRFLSSTPISWKRMLNGLLKLSDLSIFASYLVTLWRFCLVNFLRLYAIKLSDVDNRNL